MHFQFDELYFKGGCKRFQNTQQNHFKKRANNAYSSNILDNFKMQCHTHKTTFKNQYFWSFSSFPFLCFFFFFQMLYKRQSTEKKTNPKNTKPLQQFQREEKQTNNKLYTQEKIPSTKFDSQDDKI